MVMPARAVHVAVGDFLFGGRTHVDDMAVEAQALACPGMIAIEHDLAFGDIGDREHRAFAFLLVLPFQDGRAADVAEVGVLGQDRGRPGSGTDRVGPAVTADRRARKGTGRGHRCILWLIRLVRSARSYLADDGLPLVDSIMEMQDFWSGKYFSFVEKKVSRAQLFDLNVAKEAQARLDREKPFN